MATQNDIESEARRQAEIQLRKEQILEEMRTTQKKEQERDWPQAVDDSFTPSSRGSGSFPWWAIWWGVLLVVVLLAYWWLETSGLEEPTSPPPRPAISKQDAEEFWARLGVDDSLPPKTPQPPPSFKPSHEGLGFYGYGEAGGKLMWEDP